jgi:hypothetical protein
VETTKTLFLKAGVARAQNSPRVPAWQFDVPSGDMDIDETLEVCDTGRADEI